MQRPVLALVRLLVVPTEVSAGRVRRQSAEGALLASAQKWAQSLRGAGKPWELERQAGGAASGLPGQVREAARLGAMVLAEWGPVGQELPVWE
ncbi:MAG: hypothetical protein IPK15_10415 [Verrucomicrobia bacterium]|nr:hypothetical protein [Verrucomicrobiota bacterium]